MKSYKENISTLIVSKIKGTITERELVELDCWVNASAANKALYDKLMSHQWFEEKAATYSALDSQRAKMQMAAKIAQRARITLIKRISVAASVAVLVIGTSLLWNQASQNSVVVAEQKGQSGGYKALLTLEDGTEVKIGSDESGVVEANKSDNVVIEKDKITYSRVKIQKPTINKLFVARKENYSIILNDGTRVWLNSETELKYPTAFSGDKREVFLKGEAYFEVQKSKIPFIVKTPNSSIRVVGTCFNVSCYRDEPELTTLTEGRVELKNSMSNKVVTLNPGMQGIIYHQESDIEVKNVDTDIYQAWRYGVIHFENETLENIMKCMSRWYDIDVKYSDEQLRELHFYIKIAKEDSIDDFIQILEMTQLVKCHKEDNIIVITDCKK